jgi:hypothetical protein
MATSMERSAIESPGHEEIEARFEEEGLNPQV